MRRFQYILLLFVGLLFSSMVCAQNVTNVDFYQDGKTIVVTYTLDQTADISVHLSTDGGRTFSAPLQQVSGHVGKRIQPGNKKIVWNVLAEYNKLIGDNIMFMVTAAGDKRILTVNGVKFMMIYVQGGTFAMGATPEQGSEAEVCEKPTHQVTLSDYYIAETEVTQALWKAVMGYTPTIDGEQWTAELGLNDGLPAYYISWQDCQAFVKRLNELTGLAFRLPTEAEWEYAARGGNKSKGYKYSGSNYIDDVAVTNNNKGIGKIPNELGIFDMSGNVCEWCFDWYGNYDGMAQTNPTGPVSGTTHVARGGAYATTVTLHRVSARLQGPDTLRSNYVGMRLVLEP